MSNPGKRDILKGAVAGAALALVEAPLAHAATIPAGAVLDRKLDLDWRFRQADNGDWLPGTIPGTVHTDLLANGKIEDPFYRTNERDLQWIDKKDWEYRASLDLGPDILKHGHIELCFEGLDTYAEVYLNDALILKADNMFRTWVADIKPQARQGANSLRVLLRSPIQEGLKRLDALGYNPPAINDQSENGGLGDKQVSVFTRKAGYHYGWDWGPRFVTSGIWRPVRLRAWNGVRIDDLHIVQNSLSADEARLTAVFEIRADQAETAVVEVQGAGRRTVSLTPGLNTVRLDFTVAKPKLWWSNGLGEAHLYEFAGRVTTATASDLRRVSTGLRTVRVVQEPDADGTSFYVELNGVPVFMKGANYIPNDSFLPRVTHEVYERVVRSVADTHMNMLRVWGGGVYEDDYFYDLCDRNGILVWQDFMFACAMYPDDEALLDSIRHEAADNIRRLRNHPCIALWAGNNEIDTAWQNDVPNSGWGWKEKYTPEQRDQLWAAYKAIFYRILPEALAEHDPRRFYWPSSPLAAWDGKETVVHADLAPKQQSGDIHYWSVWWGQKPFADYRTQIGRFMSEYGFQSFPEFRTVEAYARPEDYDIFSEVMKAHQRSSIGNGTIKTYMERDYRVPADFRQFLYVGQVLQAEGIKIAMEGHRARMPYCMGSLFWQINDCWPVASWSSIDYYGRWKAQQYFARKAFAPVLVTAALTEDMVGVTLVNDRQSDIDGALTLKLMDFHGLVRKTLTQAVKLPANSAQAVFSASAAELLAGAAPETVLLEISLSDKKSIIAGDRLYFRPVKDLILPKPEIATRIKLSGRDVLIGLTSPVLVKNLCLSHDAADGTWSDNYFDLLPGQAAVVRFTPSKPVKAFEVGLRLMHMADVS